MTANKKLFYWFCQQLSALHQLTQMDRVRSGEALMVDEGSFLSVVKNRLIFSMDCFSPVKLKKTMMDTSTYMPYKKLEEAVYFSSF